VIAIFQSGQEIKGLDVARSFLRLADLDCSICTGATVPASDFRVPMQHDIDANGIEWKDDQAVSGLCKIPAFGSAYTSSCTPLTPRSTCRAASLIASGAALSSSATIPNAFPS
jgi:hypothetical protein